MEQIIEPAKSENITQLSREDKIDESLVSKYKKIVTYGDIGIGLFLFGPLGLAIFLSSMDLDRLATAALIIGLAVFLAYVSGYLFMIYRYARYGGIAYEYTPYPYMKAILKTRNLRNIIIGNLIGSIVTLIAALTVIYFYLRSLLG